MDAILRVADPSERIIDRPLTPPYLLIMKGTAVTHEHHIAIVDDDESVREAATNLFRSMGFPVVAFASAEEFLRSDSVERTSCIVLDVQMPGMGGLRLQSHLSAAGRHIPIVFVTAYPVGGARTNALASGPECV